ncbi:putative integral membrane protein [Mycobacterium tuberculosis]|uniref:Integral membrane protein n=1 Tax=Mycobacterium tuberculosis TaxID=1773 RepID=A0A654ZYG5_MYCTX|nr:putative integral membrane protein [Mycobacterium tuberculosis]CFS17782.1 putative integral membrane protein [Mycobacterium tuberculosis]CKR75334.1 putative integral membrane protein [Mycobacterium tuberculosis]COW17248.1 putative integral membrane protein [Mycobacterium tuberculosis]CPC13533.1 putative integral membrane protein [Mycobacterium tuberculosis]
MAGAVELALIGLLVVTGQTLMAISVAFLVALGGPLVVVNHRRAERSRG